MKNRVYGALGVRALKSNFNADFTGIPRNLNGQIISTDKALKFLIRKFWDIEGKNVFAIKSYNENFNPRTLKERYEHLFGELSKSENTAEVLNNLFECIDIKNFGATFAEAGYNFSVTGAVQIGHGINLFDDVHIETLEILSPYRNPTAKKDGSERSQTTVGELIIADEAHYFFPFSINPASYKEFEDVTGFTGYERSDFEAFKKAGRLAATAYRSASKNGVDNEFALFIELKENSKAYIPNLVEHIGFAKEGDGEKDIIDLSNLEFINDISAEINSIEVYYNPYITCIKEKFNKEFTRKFNIFTGKEV